jgi:hypothetical protein
MAVACCWCIVVLTTAQCVLRGGKAGSRKVLFEPEQFVELAETLRHQQRLE